MAMWSWLHNNNMAEHLLHDCADATPSNFDLFVDVATRHSWRCHKKLLPASLTVETAFLPFDA